MQLLSTHASRLLLPLQCINMNRVNANGYFDADNNENARYEKRKQLNAQRTQRVRPKVIMNKAVGWSIRCQPMHLSL